MRVTAEPAAAPLVRRHAIAWGLVALGLVTIVAMAAHGSAWSDDRGGEVRSIPPGVLIAGAVAACILAAVLLVLSLARVGARESADQRRRRWVTAIGFIALLAVISMIRGFVHPSNGAENGGSRPAAPAAGGKVSGSEDGGSDNGATWWPLVIVGLGSVAALGVASTRRRASAAPEPAMDATTVELLDASLDDLHREPDARRAVIAAYARMESGFARLGFARTPSETPTEYLERAVRSGAEDPLVSHPIAVQALAELTALAHLRDELRSRVAATEDAAAPAIPAVPGRAG